MPAGGATIGDMARFVATALAVVAASAAVGVATAGASRWSEPVCARHATWIVESGQDVIRHYSGMVYPADVSLLLLRNRLEQFRLHGCTQHALGSALVRQLTARERARLLSLLPADLARLVRRAVSTST